jgi:hypothetical protein
VAAIARIALSDFFRLFEPTYVLGTTYTLSLAFFEGLVLPKFSQNSLRRCLLLTDQTGFQQTLVEAGGGGDRLSIGWFHRWVHQHLDHPIGDMLREVFSQLVFAQHIKVALMRFDGEIQRLRFTLGDEGFIPTAEVGDKLGEHPVRMVDRLNTYIALLDDLDVLRWQDDGRLVQCSLWAEAQLG